MFELILYWKAESHMHLKDKTHENLKEKKCSYVKISPKPVPNVKSQKKKKGTSVKSQSVKLYLHKCNESLNSTFTATTHWLHLGKSAAVSPGVWFFIRMWSMCAWLLKNFLQEMLFRTWICRGESKAEGWWEGAQGSTNRTSAEKRSSASWS